jgi:acyl phosphate:glycerol-3-phosphate acyltransferase
MEFLLILLAYLLGSIPTGYVLGSWAGVDVRKAGSGNVGATNVARVVGKRQGLLTLIGDTAKGFVAVLVAVQLNTTTGVTALVAVAAFLGHLYPVFLRFHGGKGVATALGVLLGLAPLATVVLIAIFVLSVVTSRLVSLSSIIAAALAPLALWWFAYPAVLVGASAVLAVMIILRHRGNIRRLLAGTEPKFGS